MLRLKAKKVELPVGLKTNITQSPECTTVQFSTPVPLPVDTEALKGKVNTGSLYLALPDWADHITAILRETIPQYVGTEGFYVSTPGNPESPYGNHRNRSWRMEHHNPEFKSLDALLFYEAKPAGTDFGITFKQEGNFGIPELSGVDFQVKIVLPMNIPSLKDGKEDDSFYVLGISLPIARALFANTPIPLNDVFRYSNTNQPISGVYNFSLGSKIYLQTNQPEVEGVKRAVNLAQEIGEFYRQHAHEFQRLAEIVSPAYLFLANNKQRLIGAHASFMNEYSRVRKAFGEDLVLPQGIGDMIGQIDARCTEMLLPTEPILDELRQNFPRALLSYAQPGFSEERLFK